MSDEAASRLQVTADAAGTRLDRFLARSLGSRSRAQSLIAARRVRVDGRPAPKRHLVAVGEIVELDPDEALGADTGPVPFAVAYEDDDLLVVDKPPGVVVHPARGHKTGTLAQALSARGARGGEPLRPGIVHRLDRDTSGLMVVAKSDAVHRTLKDMLAARGIRRQYLALVDGHPSSRAGTIDAPIGRDRRNRLLISVDSHVAREARTHFEVQALLAGATLLRVTLETGRTHQIRVHLAAIGHPVSGDPQYGVRGRFGLARQFLHAWRLAFEHPVSGVALDLRSPLPDDLQAALEQVESARRRPPPR